MIALFTGGSVTSQIPIEVALFGAASRKVNNCLSTQEIKLELECAVSDNFRFFVAVPPQSTVCSLAQWDGHW